MMKLITPYSITLTSIVIAIILSILNSLHLEGFEFFDAVAPTFILASSFYFTGKLSNERMKRVEVRYEALLSRYQACAESLLKK